MDFFEENYYNENGDLKYLPNEFYYDIIKFDNYYYSKKENRIYATIDNGVKIYDYRKQEKSKSMDLLLGFISIWKEFENNLFSSLGKLSDLDRFLDDDNNKEYIDIIINWCIKYGYPFKIVEKESRTKKLFKINYNKKYSFPVIDFIIKLNEVYALYNIYLILIREKEKFSKPTYININDKFPEGKLIYKNLEKCKTEELCEIFENKYNRLNLQGVIKFEKGAFVEIKVDNLFDAVLYQIVLNMYNPYNEIKFCKRCHKPFEVTNRKQLYCHAPCTPQNAYAEKKRIRQKNKPAN